MGRIFWCAVSLCVCVISSVALAEDSTSKQKQATATGKVRNYYIAADEVDWNYMPSGTEIDRMTGKPFDKNSKMFIERGPHRIGTVYRKAIYREYTDASFTKLKAHTPEWEHLGMLGPVLRAEVGDTIKILFKNQASRPYTMHPHGVFYLKNSEGAFYEDGTSGADKADDSVPPGGMHTYVWSVPASAGPAEGDPSSIVWLYHSHHDEGKDVNSGLMGGMVITARGKARPDGRPKDVDREFVVAFMVFDENQTWYLDHNIQTYTSDPKGVIKGEISPVDADGASNVFAGGFAAVNHKHSINGYIYGDGPMMTMKKGERVRWYLLTLGGIFNFHTPHWHGNVLMHDRRRTDLVGMMPAQMLTLDMNPDNPGIWMLQCHMSQHMAYGMRTNFKVSP